jgi:hypothetical protein
MKRWQDYVVGASYWMTGLEAAHARSAEDVKQRVMRALAENISHTIASQMTVESRTTPEEDAKVYRCEVVVIPVAEFMLLIDSAARDIALRFGRHVPGGWADLQSMSYSEGPERAA